MDWRKWRVAVTALVKWGGEAIVGLIPLIGFQVAHNFAAPIDRFWSCPLEGPVSTYTCRMVDENASQEMCILTVVISGLAIWSLLTFLAEEKRASVTVFTQILVILSILSFIAGAILYALYSSHIARNADTITTSILVLALISSLSIAVERALLDA